MIVWHRQRLRSDARAGYRYGLSAAALAAVSASVVPSGRDGLDISIAGGQRRARSRIPWCPERRRPTAGAIGRELVARRFGCIRRRLVHAEGAERALEARERESGRHHDVRPLRNLAACVGDVGLVERRRGVVERVAADVRGVLHVHGADDGARDLVLGGTGRTGSAVVGSVSQSDCFANACWIASFTARTNSGIGCPGVVAAIGRL